MARFQVQRFSQQDGSHSGLHHSGLGVSIIRACATLPGGECRARLSREGETTVEVESQLVKNDDP